MGRTLILIPASKDVAISLIARSLGDVFESREANVALLSDHNLDFFDELLSNNDSDSLLESLVKQRENLIKDKDLVIVEGISLENIYAMQLNFDMAMALNASIIFICGGNRDNFDQTIDNFKIITAPYFQILKSNIIGSMFSGIKKIEEAHLEKFKVFGQKINVICNCSYPFNDAMAVDFQNIVDCLNENVDIEKLLAKIKNTESRRITPAFFRYNLIKQAKLSNKKIVLPEGEELRTLEAANNCADIGIGECILLGNPTVIKENANKIGIQLNKKLKIVDPKVVKDGYVDALVECRQHKGLTHNLAKKYLENNIVLGTMMLKLGDADGLVAGAINTTANVIRPALQIIKTKEDASLVSSIFFMCLQEQVLVYGDCAINPEPTTEELADIAIQSADTARAFGIEPYVAMLSYSSGSSGEGCSVDKMRIATELVKKGRPDLKVDGPLQYDAAINPDIAAIKAPTNPVAGKATVFVFPDLNAGNIVYKAVQRSAKILCIGPVLQGLRKPVNDLSRGCSVDDIIYTIALTAVQAKSVDANE